MENVLQLIIIAQSSIGDEMNTTKPMWHEVW